MLSTKSSIVYLYLCLENTLISYAAISNKKNINNNNYDDNNDYYYCLLFLKNLNDIQTV